RRAVGGTERVSPALFGTIAKCVALFGREIKCSRATLRACPFVDYAQRDIGERISRAVVARGDRLRVIEEGTRQAGVLLHSLLMDHSTWDAVGVELGDGSHRVAPDLP